jgi:hypothetical protein
MAFGADRLGLGRTIMTLSSRLLLAGPRSDRQAAAWRRRGDGVRRHLAAGPAGGAHRPGRHTANRVM